MTKTSIDTMDIRVNTISGFPHGEVGYELGVSACYAGLIKDYLIVAGGCNFSSPGHKKYYSGIYAAKLGTDSLEWKRIGSLPQPAAYGGTITNGDSLILVGGQNEDHRLKTVLNLCLDTSSNSPIISYLPPLPHAMDNMAVAFAEDKIFVLGGNLDGSPFRSVFSLNLRGKDRWVEEVPLPGKPRVQPVCANIREKLYIWGGFYECGDKSEVATDGLCYDILAKTYKSLPSPIDTAGETLTLTGGVAIAEGDYILCTGGVNKDIFLDAISQKYSLIKKEEYLNQHVAWYRFSPHLLAYDAKQAKWKYPLLSNQLLAKAGAQVVKYGSNLYFIGGELKPAVRSPKVVCLQLSNKGQ